jgi:hypothetical protein
MTTPTALSKRMWGLVFVSLAVGLVDDRMTLADEPAKIAVTVRSQAGRYVAESANFCCRATREAASRELAIVCEHWRQRLCQTWGEQMAARVWSPRCEIVVHANLAEYRAALGRPGDTSVGSTRMQFDGDRVVLRRIDLRCDAADWCHAALPHELTHVVLGDRFHQRPLAPWADEGIAMLSETPHKRQQRMTDLRHAFQHRSTYSIRDLLAVRQLPPAALRDAYYGQSLALTSWMIERTTPQRFTQFLQACEKTSVDAALRQEMGLDGIAELEREWNTWVQSSQGLDLVELWPAFDHPVVVASTRNE